MRFALPIRSLLVNSTGYQKSLRAVGVSKLLYSAPRRLLWPYNHLQLTLEATYSECHQTVSKAESNPKHLYHSALADSGMYAGRE